MLEYFLQIFATVLLSVYFTSVKLYQKSEGTAPVKSFLFNVFLGLFTSVIFFVVNGFKVDFSWFSFIMSVLITVVVTSYTIISFHLLKSGTVALYTMFLMSGGMLVPYFFGIIFLNEKTSVLNIIGILCMLVAMFIMNGGFKNAKKKQILLCVAVFFLNGAGSVILKTHQISTAFKAVDTVNFQILNNLVKFVLCGAIYFVLPKENESKVKINPRLIGIIFISALVSGVSSYLQMFGAISIPATVLYPIITGGTIIFSAVASRIFFKEILHKKDITAIAISFVGTLLFI